MTFDPSGDFQVFDGSESLIYSQPGQSPVAVTGVLREQLSLREAAAGASFGLQPTDVPFNLPGPNLGGVEPAGGDKMVDAAGDGWTVVSVQYDILTQQYRVMGRKQR